MLNLGHSAYLKPLSHFAAVDTCDVDEACAEVARIFCPHQLKPHEKRPTNFHAQHHSRSVNDFSINFVAYGATVDIDPGLLSGFYLLQVPISGHALVKCGSQLAEVAKGQMASILSPTLPTHMTWQVGCEKLIVQIKKQTLHAMFETLSGRHVPEIEFKTAVDLRTPIGGIINRHVMMMLEAAELPGNAHARYLATLRDGLLVELLSSFEHSARAKLESKGNHFPAIVQKADDYIMAHFDRDFTVSEIAKAVGVSLRCLQMSYLKLREMTLWERLQQVRLDQFRSKLLQAQAHQTVTEIALDAGLGHLGRTAGFYFKKFGEHPIDTLRRNRNIQH